MSSGIQLLSGKTDPRLQSAILADPRQRRILALLREQSDPIPEQDLASYLAAREAETSPAAVTEHAHQRIQIDLFHRSLPELEGAGWIERRPAGVVLAEQLPVERMDFWLSRLDDPDVPWDALAALAHPRRQHIVSIIAEHTQPLSLDEFGAALMAFQPSRPVDGHDVDDKSTLLAMLHHNDLPTLEEVGLIEYDRDTKTITRAHSLTKVSDWLDTASTTNDGVGTDFRHLPEAWKWITSIVVEMEHACEEWVRITRKRLRFILGNKSP